MKNFKIINKYKKFPTGSYCIELHKQLETAEEVKLFQEELSRI